MVSLKEELRQEEERHIQDRDKIFHEKWAEHILIKEQEKTNPFTVYPRSEYKLPFARYELSDQQIEEYLSGRSNPLGIKQ